MPHTTAVQVIHSSGATFYVSRSRAQVAVDHHVAYWRNRDILVMLKSTDDVANPNYEYGGKRSLDANANEEVLDTRTGMLITIPRAEYDRTKIPIGLSGGQQTMQLKPLVDRRTEGRHISRPDKLWRPERKRKRAKSQFLET